MDDAEFCAKVAATQEFQSLTSDMLATGLEASVQLVNPVQALRVPAASVIGVNGSKGASSRVAGPSRCQLSDPSSGRVSSSPKAPMPRLSPRLR